MTTLHADVAVVGGGLGGVAAALAVVESGLNVVLTESEPVIGGQVTSQLVSALDEHPLVETTGVTASYRDFRDRVRAAYGGVANPGNGWVSRLCFEPAIGRQVLEDMLGAHVDSGRLVVRTGTRPVSATVRAGRVTAVHLEDADGRSLELRAAVVVDATELGDLLPLTGTPWVIGSEGTSAFGEPNALPGGARPEAEQSCTWCAALVFDPSSQRPGPEPPGYARMRDGQPFSLTISGWDGVPHAYRMFVDGPQGKPPFWTYRRLRDASRLGGHDAIILNWAGNDSAASGLVAEPARTRRDARALTTAFVHWLRTEVPRDDGGYGYPEIRLAPEVSGTPDGLAVAPYVRESRRIRSAVPVTEHDLAPVSGGERAGPMLDSLGVAWYHADLHARVGTDIPVYAETAPFQIPASALTTGPPGPANLLAGAKNLAATQVAAAAYRVHPAEWAVGEAAGVVAATSVRLGVAAREVVARRRDLARVQLALLRRGAPLVWSTDLTPVHRAFVPGQLLAVAGGLIGDRADRLAMDPDGPVTDDERAALAAAADAMVIPAGPADGDTWADAAASVAAAAADPGNAGAYAEDAHV